MQRDGIVKSIEELICRDFADAGGLAGYVPHV
jgi:hypothetical protein